MTRKNRTPEENARREKIRELLQMTNISMDDIQNLFKGDHCRVHKRMVWRRSWTDWAPNKYDYRSKNTDNSLAATAAKRCAPALGM
ncbi:MAG: hypothetical protein ACLVJ6_06015 [Merdibacter sp.]